MTKDRHNIQEKEVVEALLQKELQEKSHCIIKKAVVMVVQTMVLVFASLDNWILISRLDASYGSILEDLLTWEVFEFDVKLESYQKKMRLGFFNIVTILLMIMLISIHTLND